MANHRFCTRARAHRQMSSPNAPPSLSALQARTRARCSVNRRYHLTPLITLSQQLSFSAVAMTTWLFNFIINHTLQWERKIIDRRLSRQLPLLRNNCVVLQNNNNSCFYEEQMWMIMPKGDFHKCTTNKVWNIFKERSRISLFFSQFLATLFKKGVKVCLPNFKSKLWWQKVKGTQILEYTVCDMNLIGERKWTGVLSNMEASLYGIRNILGGFQCYTKMCCTYFPSFLPADELRMCEEISTPPNTVPKSPYFNTQISLFKSVWVST